MRGGPIVKNRIAIQAILVVSLLLGGSALQAAGRSMAHSDSPSPAPHAVEVCTVTGGAYQLSIEGWQVTGAARGGSYSLSLSAEPLLQVGGCCCIYLPLVVRNAP